MNDRRLQIQRVESAATFILTRVFSIVGIAILTSAVLENGSPIQAQSPNKPLKIDPALLVEAQVVWGVVAQDDNPLWPGWNASDTPVLIYLPGVQEVLINHPSAPEEFQQVDGVHGKLFDQIQVRDGVTEIAWDGQNTSKEMFGVETLVLADTLSNRKNWLRGWEGDQRESQQKLEDLDYESLRADVYEQLAMIVHEAFHVFQMRELNHKAADERDVRNYPCLSVENNVCVALESFALEKAIRAETDTELRKYACQWMAIREHRRRNLPPKALEYEDSNEFIEGTAKYIEVVFMEQMEKTNPAPPLWYFQGFEGFEDLSWFKDLRLKQMLRNMQGKVNVNNDPYGTSPVRGRLYFSGMGIALLLDKIQPDWKRMIAAPEMSLTELVRISLRPTAKELNEGWENAKQMPEYEELIRSKTELRELGTQDTLRMLDEIRSGPGTLVEIDWSSLNSDKIGLSFTPFGVRALDSDRTIYTLVPISADLSSSRYAFRQSAPTETLEDRKNKVFQFQIREKIDVEWLEKNLGTAQDGVYNVDQLDLQVSGTQFKAAKSKVTFQDGKLRFVYLPVDQ